MNMKSYSLYIELPDGRPRHHLGTFASDQLVGLDVCLLACVSLLCGLQDAVAAPMFVLYGTAHDRTAHRLAALLSHRKGWVTESGEPFTVEAL